MATNNCEIYSAIRRPLDAFVKYFLDVKPYHTKLLEVLEIYNFYDTINVTIDESIIKDITFKNKPLCNPTGWGVNWDDACGFDAISCCDLFTCIGGYGLIYNNSDLLVSANVVSTSLDGTVVLSGNYSYDYKLPIKAILNADQFTVAGDQRNYFNTYNIFLVIPRHIYNINTITNNGFIVSGNIAPEVITRGSFIVYGSAGNDGAYVVNNASYNPATNLTTILVNEHINHVGGTGYIQVNASNKNNGAYQVLGSPIFNGVDTIVTINGANKKFTILDDITTGSIQFRSGLIYPRHVTLTGNSSNNDGDYRIMDSTYDYASNTTKLTLSGVFQDASNTGTVNLYGYEFEAGFDGNPECSVPKPADVHTIFSERVIINVIKISPTPTPSVTSSATPIPTPTVTPSVTTTVTPTVTPSTAIRKTPFTLNVTNAYGYLLYACGASNNALIDWGDGTIDNIPDGAPDGSDNSCSNGILHVYASTGNYTIKVYGDFIANTDDENYGGIYFFLTNDDPGNSSSSLTSWGDYIISQIGFPADIINVPNSLPPTVILIANMFAGAKNFNQDLSSWDTSNVIDMSGAFFNATSFNGNISGWNTTNVINMSVMFASATAFNQDLSSWDTSNVTDMSGMFNNAIAFNGNISAWNTSNVTTMSSMFSGASIFNQNLSSWNINNVTDTSVMFSAASAFNENISSWDTSNVTNMNSMFESATAFNQDLSSWCVTNIPTVPSNFASDATSWVLPKPIWGTCP